MKRAKPWVMCRPPSTMSDYSTQPGGDDSDQLCAVGLYDPEEIHHRKKKWKYRFEEFLTIASQNKVALSISNQEWQDGCECHGAKFKPTMECLLCHQTVTSTSIHNMVHLNAVGCGCRGRQWQMRFDEFLIICEEMNATYLQHRKDWESETSQHGLFYKPLMQCNICDTIVTTSNIHHIACNKTLGCGCRHKTETIVVNILENLNIVTQMSWHVQRQMQCPPDTCKYDCGIVQNGLKINDMITSSSWVPCTCVEIDGSEHFEGKLRWGYKTIHNDINRKIPNALDKKWSMVRICQERLWKMHIKLLDERIRSLLTNMILVAMSKEGVLVLIEEDKEKYHRHIKAWTTNGGSIHFLALDF